MAILAHLGRHLNRAQTIVLKLLHRRLLAMLGDIDQFILHLQLEAHKQAFEAAFQVIWLSDGGRGFWRVYRTCFAHGAVAILDFFMLPVISGGRPWPSLMSLGHPKPLLG